MTKPRRGRNFLPDDRFTPDGHPKPAIGKVGVLLINLGTPDGTDYWSMRRYLKEFLSDRRVIEVNPVLWWFILNGPILLKRPFSSGAAYRSIWNRKRGGDVARHAAQVDHASRGVECNARQQVERRLHPHTVEGEILIRVPCRHGADV